MSAGVTATLVPGVSFSLDKSLMLMLAEEVADGGVSTEFPAAGLEGTLNEDGGTATSFILITVGCCDAS